MSERRRTIDDPMLVDLPFMPNTSPSANNAMAELMINKESEGARMESTRNLRAALEANPEAARRLQRNRTLLMAIPLLLIAGFLLVIYLF